MMVEIGEQVVLTELREILPVGTVVRDIDGVAYTRLDMSRNGWRRAGIKGHCPPLPLVIMSRPEAWK